jgi:hypothetical protein
LRALDFVLTCRFGWRRLGFLKPLHLILSLVARGSRAHDGVRKERTRQNPDATDDEDRSQRRRLSTIGCSRKGLASASEVPKISSDSNLVMC